MVSEQAAFVLGALFQLVVNVATELSLGNYVIRPRIRRDVAVDAKALLASERQAIVDALKLELTVAVDGAVGRIREEVRSAFTALDAAVARVKEDVPQLDVAKLRADVAADVQAIVPDAPDLAQLEERIVARLQAAAAESPAVAMGNRSAAAREEFAAREEVVIAAITERSPIKGPLIVGWLQDKAPKQWKLIVKNGLTSVDRVLEEAEKLGLDLAKVAGKDAGNKARYIV